ncbi:MAG: hypothetical protein B6D58_02865 [candidate division Zixibacteria bacterium 4484_95]|nr:MAG: hypothetical protein B6D58_02865 [candidate division Zixibacteria bacterium 4484_95]
MIKKNVILVAVCVSFLASTIQAGDIIKKISFKGDKLSSKIHLFNRPKREFKPDSLSSDSLKIISYFQNHGWFDCQVDIDVREKGDGVEIIFNVDKKDRYFLSININETGGRKLFSDEIYSVLERFERKPAITSNIDDLANEIIEIYADNGYPYCEVKVSGVKTINSRNRSKLKLLEFTLNIQPGPEMTVEKIDFPGRKNLGYRFLETYSGLKPPFLFSTAKLKLTQRRLSLAEFLRDTGDIQVRYFKSPEKGVVFFPIKEASPLMIDGAVGYSSDDDEFYGRLSAIIKNILGKGRMVKFDWSKKDKQSRWLKVGFSEPYPMGIPLRFDIEFYQNDRDSIFIESGGTIGLSLISSDIFTYGVSLGVSKISPEFYGKSLLPQKEKLRFSVNFSADTRDFPTNPGLGDYLYIEGVFVSEKIKGNDYFASGSDNYRSINLKIEKYVHLFRSSILFVGISGQGDFSENISPDRQFPIGGFGSLRGYKQDIFYVSRSAIATVEYRLLTSRNSRAYIFSDMAFFQTPGNYYTSGNAQKNSKATEFKTGYGFGLATSVKTGSMVIEIAVPHDEGISSTKLHFGLKAGF